MASAAYSVVSGVLSVFETVAAGASSVVTSGAAADNKVKQVFVTVGTPAISFIYATIPFIITSLYGLFIIVEGFFSSGFLILIHPLTSLKNNMAAADWMSNYFGPLVYFARPLLRLLFLIPYVFIAIIRGFWTYRRDFLFVILFYFFFGFYEAFSGYVSEFVYDFSDLIVAFVDLVIDVLNLGFQLLNLFNPLYNASIDGSMELFFAVHDALAPSTTSGSGRRSLDAVDLTELTELLGPVFATVAFIYVATNRIGIKIALLLYALVGTYVVILLEGLIFGISRGACCVQGGTCCLREFGSDGVQLFLPFSVLDFSCTQPELLGSSNINCGATNALPADCTGSVPDTTYFGMYKNGCPRTRRVLCEVNDVACEFIDGVHQQCHGDPQYGCPITRRSLTEEGHTYNLEDYMISDECFELCINGTSLFNACGATWEHLGSCDPDSDGHPNARRQLQSLFPSHPMPEMTFGRRRTDTVSSASSNIQMASDLLKQLGLQFTAGSMYCDLSGTSTSPFVQFSNMICIWKALANGVKFTGRRLSDETLEEMEPWSIYKLNRLVTSRIRLYKALEHTDPHERFTKVFASSTLTDQFEFVEPIRRAVQAVAISTKRPENWQKTAREHRRLQSYAALCPPGQIYCCDGSCVTTTCPANSHPVTIFEQATCGLGNARNTLTNVDFGQIYANTKQCYAKYNTQQDTDPFGAYADTSQTTVWCLPMRKDIPFQIPQSTFSLRDWVTGLCTTSCQCPWYREGFFDYDQIWFWYIGQYLPNRIINFLIICQLAVSAVTGQFYWALPFSYGWQGFWSIFQLPTWFTDMFLLRAGFTTWNQEIFCAIAHMSSFLYCLGGLLIILALWRSFGPLSSEFLELLLAPLRAEQARLKDLHDPDKRWKTKVEASLKELSKVA